MLIICHHDCTQVPLVLALKKNTKENKTPEEKKWKPDTESEQSFAEYRHQIAGLAEI